MRRWVLHWDHQVYKALEASYASGLETLNESLALPESLRVELGFFGGGCSDAGAALALRPSLEEVRSVYYRELKKFVSLPAAFRGLDGVNGRVYAAMAGRNPRSLVRVYVKAELLFSRLAAVVEAHEPWGSLCGAGDVDAAIEACCTAAADFERSFKAVRAEQRG